MMSWAEGIVVAVVMATFAGVVIWRAWAAVESAETRSRAAEARASEFAKALTTYRVQTYLDGTLDEVAGHAVLEQMSKFDWDLQFWGTDADGAKRFMHLYAENVRVMYDEPPAARRTVNEEPTLAERLQAMHRRAQRAEGRLARLEAWAREVCHLGRSLDGLDNGDPREMEGPDAPRQLDRITLKRYLAGYDADSRTHTYQWRPWGPCSCDGTGECLSCGERDCPKGEPLHYDKDGCPECDEAGMVEPVSEAAADTTEKP